MKMLKFQMIRKRLCPSGAWDNGAYMISKPVEAVEIPEALMPEAVLVKFPEGLKGLSHYVTRIDLRGQSYLVLGNVRHVRRKDVDTWVVETAQGECVI